MKPKKKSRINKYSELLYGKGHTSKSNRVYQQHREKNSQLKVQLGMEYSKHSIV